VWQLPQHQAEQRARIFHKLKMILSAEMQKRRSTMVSLARFFSLAAAGALIALSVACITVRADEATQKQRRAGTPEASVTECQLLKRAISRRACQARAWRAIHLDTAENRAR
jgi:predicted aspartyl protease